MNFVNAGEDDVVVIDGLGFTRIEWEEVGPVEFTECRLDIGETRGVFELCEYFKLLLENTPRI